jgi:Fe-S cluster biogenesis protein NfuA
MRLGVCPVVYPEMNLSDKTEGTLMVDIEKVKAALDEIRPALQRDGGNVEFDREENGVVYVHMQGACHGCPMSQITLKKGIERLVKERVPEVISVESV